jgi:5'-nucleotidase
MADEYVLGVDLDGVCGDHTEAFRRVVASDRGVDPASLPEQSSWDFTEWGLDADDFDRLHRLAILEYRFFRTMPVVDGCADALWRLSDAGVWIRLITHRLYTNWGHAVAVADTVAWLDDHGIPYRDLCFLGQKPQVEAHAYIDDAAHNVRALREDPDALVIVFDQPHNRAVVGPRAHSWAEAEVLVGADMARRGFTVQGQLDLPGDPTGRLHGRLGVDDQ